MSNNLPYAMYKEIEPQFIPNILVDNWCIVMNFFVNCHIFLEYCNFPYQIDKLAEIDINLAVICWKFILINRCCVYGYNKHPMYLKTSLPIPQLIVSETGGRVCF